MKTVTAAHANRDFSKILRDVAAGESVEVTSHGRIVARIVPANGSDDLRRRQADALRAHLRGVRSRPAQPVEPWNRQDLDDHGTGTVDAQ